MISKTKPKLKVKRAPVKPKVEASSDVDVPVVEEKAPPRRRRRKPVRLGPRPIIAVVGRPNVGKSTLFNRLAGAHLAVVEDIAGVTRDRHYADSWVMGRPCIFLDTGGFDPESDDPMRENIARHVGIAIDEADVIVCVLDATCEPLNSDREAVKLLRRSKKPVVYVANKSDNPKKTAEGLSYYELGIPDLVGVSALHGHGMGRLEEAILSHLPEARRDETIEDPDVPRIAIVGKPNAGKSSLTNRVLGREQQIVDSRPGTTVDSIDSLVERDGRRFVLIDTAGIRRKRSVSKGVEGLGVLQAIRSLERSDAAILLIDAVLGPSDQDAKIANLADARGIALVIGLNKSDQIPDAQRKKVLEKVEDELGFLPWVDLQFLSAQSGRGVNKLLEAVHNAVEQRKKRVTTAEVNRFFEEVIAKHPPPTMSSRSVRLYYLTQTGVEPPTFMCSANFPQQVHPSYQKYVVNQIRKRFGFLGTPIRVHYRAKRKTEY